MPSTVWLIAKQQCGSGCQFAKKAPDSGAFRFAACIGAIGAVSGGESGAQMPLSHHKRPLGEDFP